MEEFMLPCFNKELFGLDCLGCGGQRALVLVLQGEFTSALKMFPAIYTLLIFLIFLIVNLFFKFKADRQIKIGFIFLNASIIIAAYVFKMTTIIF